MATICSHTIAKNSEDFIEPVLRQILPYVDKAIVSVDFSSTDRTVEIVTKLARENKKILFLCQSNGSVPIKSVSSDKLTSERNYQIEATNYDNLSPKLREKYDYIWIVDDDEYYFKDEIEDILSKIDDNDSYSVKFWFLTDRDHYNPARGKRTIRFYKNITGLKWKEKFGNEFIPVETTRHLSNSYIHLSYLKKDSWRKEFGKNYAYTKQFPIQKLPDKICQKLEPFWEGRCPKQQKPYGSGN